MAERLDFVKLAPARDPRCRLRHRRGARRARARAIRGARVVGARPRAADARRARASARARGRSLLRAAAARPVARPAPRRAPAFVCADIDALPLAAGAFDLVWSNLALQWVERPAARARRVPARAQGRRAAHVHDVRAGHAEGAARARSPRADGHTHVNRFVDMHDIGDMLVHAGFADPVMDMEHDDADLRRRRRADARPEGDRRDQRDARAAARPDGPRTLASAMLAALERDAPRRPHPGDVRGRLRPRVEGRAASAPPRAMPIVQAATRPRAVRVHATDDARHLRHRHRHRRRQDRGRGGAAARARRRRACAPSA